MAIVAIIVENMTMRVETIDTPTTVTIVAACPFSVRTNTWGDEVYFSTPVSVPLGTDARTIVEAGELAYWPDGGAIAIGFGPTPISQGNKFHPASTCDIWGRALDDVQSLASLPAGALVRVEVEPAEA